ncbi:MAG: hypothetical protein JST00_14595 [Deltaproteobacteria bacterium]|nr:hypothetical protein [Deltaproteobacteria bacterium]
MNWDTWKKGFDAWESATAKYIEVWMKNPLVLGPAGMMLGSAMKAKAAYDKAASQWVSAMGMATKRDQERALHTLNQLESRLIDLEERLQEALAQNKQNAKPEN